jgi:hypothetical protein
MTTVTVAAVRTLSPAGAFVRLMPGVLLLFAIGYAGKFTEQAIAAYGRAHQLTLPNIEYVLWAIVFGLIVSNTVGVPAICEAGVETYEFWLKTGIVLLGVRFVLGDVAKLGGLSLACVALELAVSIAVMTALGSLFRLPPTLTSLLAIGASVCGVRRSLPPARRRRRRGCVTRSRRFWRLAPQACSCFRSGMLAMMTTRRLWSALLTTRQRQPQPAPSHARGSRRAREDRPQRDDRFRRARLRAVLGPARWSGGRDQ